ncbi:MAG: TIGR03749 family integrating conjugative element protein [Chromatiaceae bacterium]|nr:TIGR03749 family integrating conjugative element protein [Chromatiaceae bacterium]
MLCALLCLAPVIAWADTANGEAPAPERIIWQKTPIAVALTVGRQGAARRFPGPGQSRLARGNPVGTPGAECRRHGLPAGAPAVRSNPGHGPRGRQRGHLPAGSLRRQRGRSGSCHPDFGPRDAKTGVTAEEGAPLPALPAYGYVTLTRFAAQQLYAPARLLHDLPGVVRVPVRREPVHLVRAAPIEASPLVAWRASGLYITAVKLRNLGTQAVTLDPRTLRGSWLTAAFQHNRLHPAGDEADTTALYLISARPFETAL